MLHELVKQRNEKQKELKQERKAFKQREESLVSEINELLRLEAAEKEGFDSEKINLAESVISVEGNPYGETSDVTKFKGNTIAEHAIIDIADDCPHLKSQYFGNKRYEGFYQRTDCPYGRGPGHGHIVDRIELKAKDRNLTDAEKDACIYYLKNYNEIKSAKFEPAKPSG